LVRHRERHASVTAPVQVIETSQRNTPEKNLRKIYADNRGSHGQFTGPARTLTTFKQAE